MTAPLGLSAPLLLSFPLGLRSPSQLTCPPGGARSAKANKTRKIDPIFDDDDDDEVANADDDEDDDEDDDDIDVDIDGASFNDLVRARLIVSSDGEIAR